MENYIATKLAGKREGCIRADFFTIAADGTTMQPRGWLVTRKGESVEAAYRRNGGGNYCPVVLTSKG